MKTICGILLALAALSAACNHDCPVQVTRGSDGRWIVGNSCR